MSQGLSLTIPVSAQAITPKWLTLVMRRAGLLQHSTVQSVEIVNATIGNGIAAHISRIGVRYDQDEQGQPLTLVVKTLSDDPRLRAIFEGYGAYRREAFFYNQIAAQIQIRSPRCYFAAYTPDKPAMMLLLEDLGEYENCAWSAGCSLHRAKEIIRFMALLHAAWWMNPKLNEMSELLTIPDPDGRTNAAEFTNRWPAALEVLQLDRPLQYRSACKKLEDKITPAFVAVASPPWTINHMDLQLENMFFGTKPGHASFVLSDWAIIAKANPGYDLGFFMCTNLDPSIRQVNEAGLLNEYLSVLAENGVGGYTLQDCLPGYHAALVTTLKRMIDAVYSQLPLTAEKADALSVIVSRNLSAIIDHEVWNGF